jgi:hypothetical protein
MDRQTQVAGFLDSSLTMLNEHKEGRSLQRCQHCARAYLACAQAGRRMGQSA